MAGATLAGCFNLLMFYPMIHRFEAKEGIVRGTPESVISAAAFAEYFPNPVSVGPWGLAHLPPEPLRGPLKEGTEAPAFQPSHGCTLRGAGSGSDPIGPCLALTPCLAFTSGRVSG